MLTWSKNEEFNGDRIADEYILFKEANENLYFLNEVAYYIWSLCTGVDLETIVSKLVEKFNTDVSKEQLSTDVVEILEEFEKNNLVVKENK